MIEILLIVISNQKEIWLWLKSAILIGQPSPSIPGPKREKGEGGEGGKFVFFPISVT